MQPEAKDAQARPLSPDDPNLREFYRRCRPPGLWGPVVADFDAEARREIRRETLTDLTDCALGVVFCTAAILAVVSPLGRHWWIFLGAVAVGGLSGGLFITRWARRRRASEGEGEREEVAARPTVEPVAER